MVAAAAAAGDPPLELNTRQYREEWVNLDPGRFAGLCATATQDGDYRYVRTALKASNEGIISLLSDRATNDNNQVIPQEAFQMLQMTQK